MRRGCPCAICARRNSPSRSTGRHGGSSARSSSRKAANRRQTPRNRAIPYVSNNTDRRPGRLIMLVVDRNNIDTHTIRGAVAALKRFVAGVSRGRSAGARDHTASRAVCRFHDQPRADPQCNHECHGLGGPDVLAVQHQRLRGDHLRKSIEPDRHAAAAVSCVRRYRSQYDVALRSRRRAGGVDEGDTPPPAHVAVRIGICRAAEEPARRRRPEVDDHPLAGLDARGGAGRVVSPCDARGRGAGQHQRADVRAGGGKRISIPHLGDALAGSRSARSAASRRWRDARAARSSASSRIRSSSSNGCGTKYPHTTCWASSRPSETATASRIRSR